MKVSEVAEMRAAFDRAFAEPSAEERSDDERLLLVRVAGHPYALRVGQVVTVVADRKIVPVPTRVPDLVGLAGVRGGLVAVYRLARLLGHEAEVEGARWIALCQSEEPVALSFGEIESQLRVPARQIVAGNGTHTDGVVQTDTGPRPLISIPSILEEIRRRCDRVRGVKER